MSWLCGIALAHENTAPAMNMAAMAIAVCGDVFRDDQERNALLEVLNRTQKLHAWPTKRAAAHLRNVWGWYGDGDTGLTIE